jgi:hypothetical protein
MSIPYDLASQVWKERIKLHPLGSPIKQCTQLSGHMIYFSFEYLLEFLYIEIAEFRDFFMVAKSFSFKSR